MIITIADELFSSTSKKVKQWTTPRYVYVRDPRDTSFAALL